MSVLIDKRNLIIGNGDLFLADTVSDLPTISAYKTALGAGTVGTLTGNVGAIKGTASIQIVRELAMFEVGIPQEVADQTCIREGIHFKVGYAEQAMANVQKMIGGGVLTTASSGTLHTTLEAHTAHKYEGNFVAIPFTNAPVLLTSSTPAAGANPVIKDSTLATTYVLNTDYTIDLTNNTFTPLGGGAITDGEVLNANYYSQTFSSETLTMGGQSSVLTSALLFIHPYSDGRVMALTIYAANPSGTVTLPFEEIAYGNTELEFKGIADFTKAAGNYLFNIYRELPQ